MKINSKFHVGYYKTLVLLYRFIYWKCFESLIIILNNKKMVSSHPFVNILYFKKSLPLSEDNIFGDQDFILLMSGVKKCVVGGIFQNILNPRTSSSKRKVYDPGKVIPMLFSGNCIPTVMHKGGKHVSRLNARFCG